MYQLGSEDTKLIFHDKKKNNEIFLIHFSANKDEWRLKEAAVFLVASLGTKKKTQRHGVTETSEILPVVQFWDQHIQGDLLNSKPALMGATIKFLSLFRLIIGQERLQAAMKPLSQLLTHDSMVVSAYAAHALERILMTRMPVTKQPLVTKGKSSKIS